MRDLHHTAATTLAEARCLRVWPAYAAKADELADRALDDLCAAVDTLRAAVADQDETIRDLQAAHAALIDRLVEHGIIAE